MPDRSYEGDALDHTWQDIQDRPYSGEGETVWDSRDQEIGEIKTVGDPYPTKSEVPDKVVDAAEDIFDLANSDLPCDHIAQALISIYGLHRFVDR